MKAAPFVVCTVLWAVIFAGFYFGPFEFHPAPSGAALTLMLACIGLFVASGIAGYVLEGMRAGLPGGSSRLFRRFDIDRVVRQVSTVALIGTLCIVVDRVGAQGLSGFAGLTELRYERAEDLLAASELNRSVLTYFGYLMYPALYLVVALGMCYYEGLSGEGKLLLTVNMVSPFVLAILFGGRSPIFVLFLIVASSCVVRRMLGLRALPAGGSLKVIGIVAVLCFVLYTNLIWFQRLELSSQTVNLLLAHADKVWGIEPKADFERWLANIGREDLIVPLLGGWFYFFQGPSIFERLVAMGDYPVLFGGYHIDIVAAGFRLFGPSRTMLADGYAALLAANVYGFFPTAWGSLLIDYSVVTFPLVATWGAVSGSTYLRLRRFGRPEDAIFYVYLFYAVLISPISAPFGLANSFVTFLYFLAFKLLLYREGLVVSGAVR